MPVVYEESEECGIMWKHNQVGLFQEYSSVKLSKQGIVWGGVWGSKRSLLHSGIKELPLPVL